MTCTEALELMLGADLAELAGTADSELSMHVRGCADCQAAARRIVTAERELGRALTEAAPRRGVEDAVRKASRATRRGRWVWRAVPLAAAATLATLLLGRWHSDRISSSTAPYRPLPSSTAPVDVQPPPGRSVAVFKTENPDIVVIWFF